MQTHVSASQRRISPGFTLAEILILIVMLSFLVAALLAVTGRAGQAADKARTLSHMKHLGIAFHLYAADHGNILPSYRPYGGSSSPGDSSFWISYIRPYLGRPYSSLHDPLHIRMSAPSLPVTTYGMNSSPPAPFWSLAWVEEPAKAMLLLTMAPDATTSKYRIPANLPDQIGFHHGRKALALYVDGHIGQVTREEIPPWAARSSSHIRHKEFNAFWNYLKDRGTGIPGPPAP